MNRRHFVTDPIHGNIEIPRWLVQVKDELSIRRMMNIKQLGLKAFIDFPGAIHTRYLHSLGTMHLAGKLVDLLIEKEETKGRAALKDNLSNNKNCLVAAGFFHDIGHGPFSHVLDFILEKGLNTNHTEVGIKIIKKFEDVLLSESIPVDAVCQIISAEHKYPFLGDIINNSMDVDKVDYLIRDSYFVGLRYSFDLNHFLSQITISGEGERLEEYRLVLEDNPEAKASAEIFGLIYKTLYDLVYYVEFSRIAEKMLEKAILNALKIDKDFKSEISNVDKFIEIDEYNLFEKIKGVGDFQKKIVEMIRKGQLYSKIFDKKLEADSIFKFNEDFLESLRDHDNVSEEITQKLNLNLDLNESKPNPYSLICDIIRTKIPKDINIDKLDEEGEPIPIKSPVIDVLKNEELQIKIYMEPEISKKKRLMEENLIKEIQQIIDAWKK